MRLRHALGVAFAIAVTLTPAALAADTAAPPQVTRRQQGRRPHGARDRARAR